jgi:hypothetical protein
VNAFFSVYLTPQASVGAGFSQPVTKMSTRSSKIMYLVSKELLVA